MDAENSDIEYGEEYHLLVTRAKCHRMELDSDSGASCSTPKPKRKHDNLAKFLLSGYHNSVVIKGCRKCLVFPMQESLPNGSLPITKQVLSYLFYMTSSNSGQQRVVRIVASDIILHWISCNIYTVTLKMYCNNLSQFIMQCESLFDINIYTVTLKMYCNNLSQFIMQCESLFNINIYTVTLKMYCNNLSQFIMQCESLFDINIYTVTLKMYCNNLSQFIMQCESLFDINIYTVTLKMYCNNLSSSCSVRVYSTSIYTQ